MNGHGISNGPILMVRVSVSVRVSVRVTVKFAFCSLGFSLRVRARCFVETLRL